MRYINTSLVVFRPGVLHGCSGALRPVFIQVHTRKFILFDNGRRLTTSQSSFACSISLHSYTVLRVINFVSLLHLPLTPTRSLVLLDHWFHQRSFSSSGFIGCWCSSGSIYCINAASLGPRWYSSQFSCGCCVCTTHCFITNHRIKEHKERESFLYTFRTNTK